MQTTFSEFAYKYAPWSATKLSVAKHCGLQFFYKYIDKIKGIEPQRPDTKVGSAAHKGMEMVLQGEQLGRAFRLSSLQFDLTDKEMDDYVSFAPNLHEFLLRITKFKADKKIPKSFIEYNFGLTDQFKPTDFFATNVFFRGSWDLSFFTPDNDLIIIDHKTSSEESETKEKYETQLNLYAVSGRFILPSMQGVQAALHYVRTGKIVWNDYISVNHIDEKLVDWFVHYVNTTANVTKTATPGWQCTYCAYTHLCDAYKELNKTNG